MASGLPIAATNYGPLVEILENSAEFFNANDAQDIAEAILRFIQNPELRQMKAEQAFALAGKYSWARCANETFDFLQQTMSDKSA